MSPSFDWIADRLLAIFDAFVEMPEVFVAMLPALVEMSLVFVAMFAVFDDIFPALVAMSATLVAIPLALVAMLLALVAMFAVLVAMSVERPLISVPTFSPIFPSMSVAAIFFYFVKLRLFVILIQKLLHLRILLELHRVLHHPHRVGYSTM